MVLLFSLILDFFATNANLVFHLMLEFYDKQPIKQNETNKTRYSFQTTHLSLYDDWFK